MAEKCIFRIIFIQNDVAYEMYAKQVCESEMFGFLVVEDIIFGEKTSVVVDPSEEKLKSQFSNVKRTYVPMHAVIRVDELSSGKEGTAKITQLGKGSVSHFPGFAMPPKSSGDD